jgi:hypothetical protein
MKAFVKAVVLGLLLVSPSDVGWAKPSFAMFGQKWCECLCANPKNLSQQKVIEYETFGTCTVGADCKFTKDGGKSWTKGTLANCWKCTGNAKGDWDCTFLRKSLIPSGTLQLQPATPRPQPPAVTTPPSEKTLQ